MNPKQPNSENQNRPQETLHSWKEIAAYIQRNEATARRWEREERLPVHRHSHKIRSSVFAYPAEIDAWKLTRKVVAPEAAPAPVTPPWWRPVAAGFATLSCLVMVGSGIHPQLASAQSLTARQIPVKNAAEVSSVSRDGRFMATVGWEKGGGDLVIREVASGRDKVLQKGACVERGKRCVFADQPILSPDGKQVAYSWYDDDENDGVGQLRVIENQAGATPRVLVRGPQYNVWPYAWSPDSKSILAWNGSDKINSQARTPNARQIVRVRVSDGAVTVVKTVQWPSNAATGHLSLSPDGKWITYSKPTGTTLSDRQIVILPADGSDETALTKGAGINDAPVWTPDGTHVLYTSNQSGQFDLWSIAVREGRAAGVATVVKPHIGRANIVGLTAAGTLLYTSTRTDVYDTLAEITQSGATITLRNTDKFVGGTPTWSPDGKSVAFARSHPGRQSDPDLVLRTITGGEEQIYHIDRMATARPTWSPDGRGIVVAVVSEKNELGYYRLDIPSGHFSEVAAADPSNYGPVTFGPDDRTLYFAGRESLIPPIHPDRVFAYDLATKQKKEVFKSKDSTQTVFWFSPDGSRVAIRTDENAPPNGKTRFGVANADWSGYQEIYSVPVQEVSGRPILAWTPDGRSLLFGKAESGRDDQGQTMIMRIPIEGGQPEFTGLRVSSDVQQLANSEDGSHMAVVSRETTSELWALDHVLSALK